MFYELMRRRGPLCFYAFDLLGLDGSDLWERPLFERKRLLRKLLLRPSRAAQYVEHFASGTDLFRVICDRDMEGIVGKRQAPGTHRKRRPESRSRTGSISATRYSFRSNNSRLTRPVIRQKGSDEKACSIRALANEMNRLRGELRLPPTTM
jgi:hypothetical protein